MKIQEHTQLFKSVTTLAMAALITSCGSPVKLNRGEQYEFHLVLGAADSAPRALVANSQTLSNPKVQITCATGETLMVSGSSFVLPSSAQNCSARLLEFKNSQQVFSYSSGYTSDNKVGENGKFLCAADNSVLFARVLSQLPNPLQDGGRVSYTVSSIADGGSLPVDFTVLNGDFSIGAAPTLSLNAYATQYDATNGAKPYAFRFECQADLGANNTCNNIPLETLVAVTVAPYKNEALDAAYLESILQNGDQLSNLQAKNEAAFIPVNGSLPHGGFVLRAELPVPVLAPGASANVPVIVAMKHSDAAGTSYKYFLYSVKFTRPAPPVPPAPGKVSIEPDAFPALTALRNAFTDVLIEAIGGASNVFSQTSAYSSTGSRVFGLGYGTSNIWCPGQSLQVTFNRGASEVSLTFIGDDSSESNVFLEAFDANRASLGIVTGFAPSSANRTGYKETLTVKSTSTIAYIQAGWGRGTNSGDCGEIDDLIYTPVQ